MQSSPSRLEWFVDRSLCRHDVPTALHSHGLAVHTMAGVYGPREQFVEDEEWLRDGVEAGWIVLTKDKRLVAIIRRRAALHRATLRVFILMSGNLTAAQQVERFMENMERIEAQARETGPFVFGVHHRQIRQVWTAGT